MSKENKRYRKEKTDNRSRTLVNVKENNGHVYANIHGHTAEENFVASAVLLVNLAMRYGIDITDALDTTEDIIEDLYENKEFRKNTGDDIWQNFIEYDEAHQNGRETMYDFVDLPEEEMPLYVASINTEDESFHLRTDGSEEGMEASLQSIYSLVELLCKQCDFPMKDVIDALQSTYEATECEENNINNQRLKS